MKEKRRDNKGRILHTGESQRTDGKYLYKYVDAFGNTKYVYAWRLTPTDLILSILVYTFFSRMFDLMLPPVAKHSIVVA